MKIDWTQIKGDTSGLRSEYIQHAMDHVEADIGVKHPAYFSRGQLSYPKISKKFQYHLEKQKNFQRIDDSFAERNNPKKVVSQKPQPIVQQQPKKNFAQRHPFITWLVAAKAMEKVTDNPLAAIVGASVATSALKNSDQVKSSINKWLNSK